MKTRQNKMIYMAFCALAALTLASSLVSCKKVTVTADDGTEKKVSVRKLRNQDIDTAIEYITQAYAPYDDAVKQGFDIKKARRTMKWKYTEGSLSHKYINRNKREYKIINGLDNWAMAWAVGRVFDNFPVKDRHFSVWGIDNTGFGWNHEFMGFADIMFEKEGDDYVVSFSNADGIRRGMRFTGDVENMRKISYGGRDLYRFGIFPPDYTGAAEVSLDGKSFSVPLHYNTSVAEPSAPAGFLETEDAVYVSLKSFFMGEDKEKDVYDAATGEFYDVLDKVKACAANKKSAIIDLRGNGGGYGSYGADLLAAVFYGDNEGKVKQFPAIARQYEYGALTLESPVTMKRRYDEIMNSDNFDQDAKRSISEKYQYALKNGKRLWDGLDKPVINEIPQLNNAEFKGKVYILMDEGSGSATENTIALSYADNKDMIVLVGMNSSGCIDFGDVYTYELPNSKVKMHLAGADMRRIPVFSQNPHWHGDTKGFFPDYWATNAELLDTLVSLTGDSALRTALKGLEKGQLQ